MCAFSEYVCFCLDPLKGKRFDLEDMLLYAPNKQTRDFFLTPDAAKHLHNSFYIKKFKEKPFVLNHLMLCINSGEHALVFDEDGKLYLRPRHEILPVGFLNYDEYALFEKQCPGFDVFQVFCYAYNSTSRVYKYAHFVQLLNSAKELSSFDKGRYIMTKVIHTTLRPNENGIYLIGKVKPELGYLRPLWHNAYFDELQEQFDFANVGAKTQALSNPNI